MPPSGRRQNVIGRLLSPIFVFYPNSVDTDSSHRPNSSTHTLSSHRYSHGVARQGDRNARPLPRWRGPGAGQGSRRASPFSERNASRGPASCWEGLLGPRPLGSVLTFLRSAPSSAPKPDRAGRPLRSTSPRPASRGPAHAASQSQPPTDAFRSLLSYSSPVRTTEGSPANPDTLRGGQHGGPHRLRDRR